ncbi:MAG: recombination regulator RecX [Rhodocyclaceae bacterium]|nr:recombination regulator RecX [Rhodocyclaceae bacterium]
MNELRSRAIKLLARREHSRFELARKLAAHGTQEEIDIVLADLAQSGLQSDARYAEAYVRSGAARFGAARLRQTLRQKGIADELIATQLAGADSADELARARAVWARKFDAAPADAREWARQARFLQGRGFSTDVIRRLLKEPYA